MCIDLSTVEVEYLATGSCYAQILWIKKKLCDYRLDLGCITLRRDNTSAINIKKNLTMHSRTKHVDIRHYLLRYHVLKGEVKVTFMDTHNKLTDVFTKPLVKEHFLQDKEKA